MSGRKDLNDKGDRRMPNKLLEVKGLKTYFYTDEGVVPAVDGVSFSIDEGETLGIVGESGCGKSITALSIMRLLQTPPGKIAGGEILFKGEDLLQKKESEMERIRGNEISMIFQEPMTSLNPVCTCGYQIAEVIRLHRKLDRKQAMEKAVDMLRLVGIPDPQRRSNEYPHQMSGGMRQRVMIAIALACQPKLLIADEPTTALDVTIQAQILELIKSLKNEMDMSMMMITHDLGVVAGIADKVAVMYAGKIVEQGNVISLFKNPQHPYTKGLLASIPRLNQKKEKLHVIQGMVPNPHQMPQGCRFHPRCEYKQDICLKEQPPIMQTDEGHQVACWLCQKASD